MSARRARIRSNAKRAWSRLRTAPVRVGKWVLDKYHARPRVQQSFLYRTGFKTPEAAYQWLMPEKKLIMANAVDARISHNFSVMRKLARANPNVSRDFPLEMVSRLEMLTRIYLDRLASRQDTRSVVREYDSIIGKLEQVRLPVEGMREDSAYRIAQEFKSPLQDADRAAQQGAAEIALRQVGVGVFSVVGTELTNQVMDRIDLPEVNRRIHLPLTRRTLTARDKRYLYGRVAPVLGRVKTLLFVRYFAKHYSELREGY